MFGREKNKYETDFNIFLRENNYNDKIYIKKN